MSAGTFTVVGYTASYNAGNIHPISVQPETLALTVTVNGENEINGGTPVDQVNNPISAVVSRGRRSRGLNARKITIEFTGTAPTGYRAGTPITLPAVNPNVVLASRGATGTYLGQAIRVVGTSPEVVK